MNTQNKQTTQILLPGKGCQVSDFARQACDCMRRPKSFFRHMGNVVSLSTRNCNNGLAPEYHFVSPSGFVVDSEEFIEWGRYVKNPSHKKDNKQDEYIFEQQSLCERDARRLLSSQMIKSLPEIKGILNIQMPFVDRTELYFTNPGYCERTGYWTQNTFNFSQMPIEEASNIIFNLYRGFCFLEPEVDMAISIAYLLTPALRLFLHDQRAPIFLADGNRPGVGKDYWLRVVPLLYTGVTPSDQSPCATDEEWKKSIYANCLRGAEFFIVSNLKGYLSSKALEAASTGPKIDGRILGTSTAKTVVNTAIYGFSGNGVNFSEDLERRYLHMRLECYESDINQRSFEFDLHDYIRQNRDLVLSAIFSCIVHWFENGMAHGKGRMTSFEQWAGKVTGIMKLCNLGNPFQKRTIITASMQIGGDKRKQQTEELVKLWAEKYGDQEINAESLRELTIENGLFLDMKLHEHGGRSSFGRMINSHSQRIFSGYRILVNGKQNHKTYSLEQIPDEDNVVSESIIQTNHHNEACISGEELPIDTDALIATDPEAPADLAETSKEELELMAEEDYEEDSAS